MRFTEAQLEQALIDLLGEQEIPHVLDNAIKREPEEVLIINDLILKDGKIRSFKINFH